jgi:hypothetical protein
MAKRSAFGLFEIVYSAQKNAALGKPFQAYDIRQINKPHLRELVAYQHFAANKTFLSYEFSGLLSPKFLQKMGISKRQCLMFLQQHQKADVFLFHPFPLELSVANTYLDLAELEHPGITEGLELLWSKLFKRRLPHVSADRDRDLCCHCNYFVASQRFWAHYSEFVLAFMQFLQSKHGKNLLRKTRYNLSVSGEEQLPLCVFVFERALTMFLKDNCSKYKIVNFASHSKNWKPRQLFDGENRLVNCLLHEVHISPPKLQPRIKHHAVSVYYHWRRIAITAARSFVI